MGCLSFLFKHAGLIFLALLGISIIQNFFIEVSTSNSNIPEEMYNDSQEVLNVINTQFLTFSLSANINEQEVDSVLDTIEKYATKYGNNNLLDEEQEMYQGLGMVVTDYLQLVGLDLSYQGVPLDFNQKFDTYSGEKRDVYESFLKHRLELKKQYGFDYEK